MELGAADTNYETKENLFHVALWPLLCLIVDDYHDVRHMATMMSFFMMFFTARIAQ